MIDTIVGRAGRPQFDTVGVGAFHPFFLFLFLFPSADDVPRIGFSLHHDGEGPSKEVRGSRQVGGKPVTLPW